MKKTLKELKNTKKPFEVIDSKDYTNLIDSISSSLKIVDTSANFTANNPILAAGQTGYETDTKKEKVGDGATAWNDLGYKLNVNYSTDEQIVGTWINGKPIYRKVVEFIIPENGLTSVDISNMHAESLIKQELFAKYKDEQLYVKEYVRPLTGGRMEYLSMSYAGDYLKYFDIEYRIKDFQDGTFISALPVSVSAEAFIIFDYTKTTD